MPKLIGFVWQMIEDMPDEAQQWAWIGLMLGFTFGAFIGQYIIIAGQAALMALDLYDFNRGNRLLITYHDMLQEIAAQQQAYEQQDGQEFSEGKKHGQPS